jgi:hypothetical protein
MIERLQEIVCLGGIKRRNFKVLGLFVLYPPDASEVMVAVRTHRGIAGAMSWTASIVVNHGLIVEIKNVKRTVRTDSRMNRPEPEIAAGDEFLLSFLISQKSRS